MAPPYLKWIDSLDEEQTYPLQKDEIVVGRKPDADVVFSDPYVSREHAKLVRIEGGYTLVDLSRGGTFVNGERIKEQQVRPGDRVYLGRPSTEFEYLSDGQVEPSTLPPSAILDQNRSLVDLAAVLPPQMTESSALEKLSRILDFQYEFGKTFSAEGTFDDLLASALEISGAERGYILLKQEEKFEYVVGRDGAGRSLPESEFQASETVALEAANLGEARFMTERISDEYAQQESIVALGLRSLACMPLEWLLPDSPTPEVRGILYLDSTKSMHALTGLDQRILRRLAAEASHVFEKLEMIKTFQERRNLELELALKQETQKRLEQELQAAEELRRAESQVLLSENAASMGRFAAALSHELNQPIGILGSTLQTFATIAEKRKTLPVEEHPRLDQTEAELRAGALKSTVRLDEIIKRMQRFTNLDRTEIIPVDLNALLQDVVDLFQSEIDASASIEVKFQSLPKLSLRPQQMSAVFSNLLHNAVGGIEKKGRVEVTTQRRDSMVEVRIRDNGKGLSEEEVSQIFDPAFRVKDRLVRTGNWSLFSSRNLIRENGGEIVIESTPGQGTEVRVTLPIPKL